MCLLRKSSSCQLQCIIYYASLMLGLASLATPHILYFIPILWILMATHLLSLSWRTWLSSLFGLLTPYWFIAAWLVYQHDFSPLVNHLSPLIDFQFPIRYDHLSTSFVMTWGLLAVCFLTGTIHFLRKSSYRHHDEAQQQSEQYPTASVD